MTFPTSLGGSLQDTNRLVISRGSFESSNRPAGLEHRGLLTNFRSTSIELFRLFKKLQLIPIGMTQTLIFQKQEDFPTTLGVF